MENQCTVQVKLEWGHGVQLRKKVTSEGYTHDWMVYVRGPETSDIQHFAEKVVFHLHEIFPNPRETTVCKKPFRVEETGNADFLMHVEVHFKNKELPKKMCFKYQLNLEGDHLRCETLTFNNPTKEFRRKLIKAGGVIVVPKGPETATGPSPDSCLPPTKKIKTSHVSEEPSKEGSNGSSQSSQADRGASLLALKRLRAKQTTGERSKKCLF